MALDICGQDAIYAPELESCDQCDVLAQEFEQAKIDAQTAASDAQTFAESAEDSVTEATAQAEQAGYAKEDAEIIKAQVQELLEEARQILIDIQGATISRYSQTYSTYADQNSFTFAPTGYTYNSADYFSVYINGLKLTPDEFTKSNNVVTLVSPVSLAGQTVEIVVDRAEQNA